MGSTLGAVSDSWVQVCGEAEEGRGLGVLVSALTNAAPGEVLMRESEMSCGLLSFLKEGAASVVLVDQKGSKPFHKV